MMDPRYGADWSIGQSMSIMPAYPWLFDSTVAVDGVADKMRVLKKLGTPYSDEQIAALVPDDGCTPRQVCDASHVPVLDRLWVLLREDIISVRDLRMLACDWAERACNTSAATDARSLRAIAVARRYADGEAAKEELDAARDAARDAAMDADLDAARDAAWAVASAVARDAARDARDAARDAWDAAWTAAWAAAVAAGCEACDAAWAAQLADVRQALEKSPGA
jgi:hypothetical protein